MNKDLYIELLEEHVGDLTTEMKIDTVLSLRKTEKIKGLKCELASVSDWNKAQDELISKIADTAMDYQDDITDLHADFAEMHNEYKGKLMLSIERNTRANDENIRLQGKIVKLEKRIRGLEAK